jgi:hypothetical protein
MDQLCTAVPLIEWLRQRRFFGMELDQKNPSKDAREYGGERGEQTLRALTFLVRTFRPEWSEQGVLNACRRAWRDHPLPDVALAAVCAARSSACHTPGIIPMPGEHWRPVTMQHTPVPPASPQPPPLPECSVCRDPLPRGVTVDPLLCGLCRI